MSQGQTKFRLHMWGEDEPIQEIEVPSALTVGDFKTICEEFKAGGYEVRINGAPAQESALTRIASALSRKGLTIRVGGVKADSATPIPDGGLVTAGGNYKGATI